MSNLLYLIAVVLVISWALGFFVYSAGSIIQYFISNCNNRNLTKNNRRKRNFKIIYKKQNYES
ncbi:lmo0937 family membrane protein [Flavobacterium sp. 5]|uniref:lmo0937 family membrane protein n=1 Tax=Flavobacterium sp. 5 TaxID=2035199 RepID=UPI000CC03F68|nr:hypothetical protein CLU82_0741 [Flavobacterium sp. 5]